MLNALRRFFAPDPAQQQAYAAYSALVTQARRSWFYTGCGMPDTLDGRFEMVLLHLFLVIARLKPEQDTAAQLFTRSVTEAFVDDMDRSLRELGVTDTGVGKRVRRMGAALYGRLQAYEEAFADAQAFSTALKRNAYGTVQPEDAQVSRLAAYVANAAEHLQAQPLDIVLTGRIGFPSLPDAD